MPLLVKVRSFLRNLFLSGRVETDLDQEVHSLLEMLIAENIRAGVSPHEAPRGSNLVESSKSRSKYAIRGRARFSIPCCRTCDSPYGACAARPDLPRSW